MTTTVFSNDAILSLKQEYVEALPNGNVKVGVPSGYLIEPGKDIVSSVQIGKRIVVNDQLYKIITLEMDPDSGGYANCELEPATKSINTLSLEIHNDNVNMGWWTDLVTGEKKDRNVGELLCLVHSEVSEAMEGYRKGLADDKLPHRSMFEVELADTLIRIFDIAGAHHLDLEGAIREKRAYNSKRADHKLENRKADGGKKF